MTPHEIILSAIQSAATPEEAATAVLELVGPVPLVWRRINTHGGDAFDTNWGGYRVAIWNGDWGVNILQSQKFSTRQDAQDACQAHANAVYWAGTKLGELLG